MNLEIVNLTLKFKSKNEDANESNQIKNSSQKMNLIRSNIRCSNLFDYVNEFKILFKFNLFIYRTEFERKFSLPTLKIIKHKILFSLDLIT